MARMYKKVVKYVPMRTKKSNGKYSKRKSTKKFTRRYKKW